LGRHEVGTDTLEFMVEAGFSADEIQKLHRSGIVKVS
jgi:hypothetical protein